MYSKSTDEELMLKYQSGDEASFQELYSRYSGRVYTYLKKRLDQRNWVDDVFQMVFVKLHKTRKQYNPAYRFDQWIFVMTKTVLLDFWKTTDVKTKRYFSKSVESLHPDDLAADRTSLGGHESLPEDLISILSPEQRQIVELKFIDELSYNEIADRLNRSEENVRQIMSRAVKKMRSLFVGDKI